MDELKNLKILYVDDEEFIRENAVEYLSFYCDNVFEAKDGLAALEKYEECEPDIIITDIKMPNMNGLEMVEHIRKKDKKTQIIIATAFLDTDYLLKAVELGLVKYLTKPITEDKLMPVLKELSSEFEDEDSSNILEIDSNFTYDLYNKTLLKNKEVLDLTKKELAFLDLLLRNKKRVVSYDEFERVVWEGYMSDDALRSVVKELRKKISKTAIKNVSGMGYQIKLESEDVS